MDVFPELLEFGLYLLLAVARQARLEELRRHRGGALLARPPAQLLALLDTASFARCALASFESRCVSDNLIWPFQ